ncbi:gem-associated protein 5 [Plakobranchus ocellatus]|uniref:Gem-associated protein 5 n=1 Tax=Plakobranchus ocellatus TaxID=259542 RepID=A0AAV3Y1G2_9GAST|nr:gem-associated protein 5 [Plakobranchus ocellatus]
MSERQKSSARPVPGFSPDTANIARHDPTDIIDKKPHLGIYTDKLGAHRCLLQESARHASDGKMDYHLHLEMWRGNVVGAVQLAQQRNELSDWIVAMSPMASRETWEKVCGAYAEQLEEDGQYYKATSYLLACHRVVDAIELFQRHGLYREAVSLAKVRLSPIDPMLESLYLEWGTQLMKEGQFEQSAKCYLAMKQVQEAGKVVARRHDQSSLKTACHMNLLMQEQEQALAYAYKVLSQYLLAAQWREAQKFLQENEGLKVFLPVVIAHEHLVQQLSLLCPDLALTQKPSTPDNFTTTPDDLALNSGAETLPVLFIQKIFLPVVIAHEHLVQQLSLLCPDLAKHTFCVCPQVFLPVVIAHEHLVQQLSLLCPDLALTQKPSTPDNFTTTPDDLALNSGAETLPEFILDKSDIDPVIPWEPVVLCESSASGDNGGGRGPGPLHTFPHHLVRVWHKRINVAMMTTDLKATRVAIDRLTKIRSSVLDLPNLLVMISIDVTSCLLALLASETSSAINHLLQAMALIHSSASGSGIAGHRLLLPALCRLMLSLGPKYLLKLQQEFKALRVLLTMESDGDMDRAGGEGYNSIKRFLTDIKEEEAISTSSNWCRELDCLRAYYYLAVLDFLQEEQKEKFAALSPSAILGEGNSAFAQENDSLDGEPTSEGSSSSLSASGHAAHHTGASQSPGDKKKDKEARAEGGGGKDTAELSHTEDFDPSQKPSRESVHSKAKKSPISGVGKSPSSKPVVSTTTNLVCDQICEEKGVQPSDKVDQSKVPGKSESQVTKSPSSAAKAQRAHAFATDASSLDSSVDPPSVLLSQGQSQVEDCSKLSSPKASPKSDPLSSASLSPTGQLSAKKSTTAMSPKSSPSPNLPLSNMGQVSSPSSHHSSPSSHHITSLTCSPSTPTSKSSAPTTQSLGKCGQLNKDNLLRLSRGLLWDTQAKSEVLTETLGYIHRAISQHLLANRTPAAPTSDSTSAASSSATAADSSEGGGPIDAEGSQPTSPSKSLGLNISPPPNPASKESSLNPLLSPGASVRVQSDSLEEDGSVQQRRLSPQSASIQGQTSPGSDSRKKEDAGASTGTAGQQLSSSLSPKSESLQPSSKPSSLPRSVSVNASPDSSSSATGQGGSPRRPVRSLSESHNAASSFDRSIGIKAERELLGELAGEPISFSNSKKVLWLDNSTKPNWPENDPPIPLSPNGTSLRTAPALWAETRRQALLAPDGSALPLEWDDLPVDVKFNQKYVTMALLKHQQEMIMQDLKKGPDISKVPFPPKSCSVRVLLECCIGSPHLSLEEKQTYIKQLADWATLFSVTTHQKAVTEALFKSIPEEFQPSSL